MCLIHLSAVCRCFHYMEMFQLHQVLLQNLDVEMYTVALVSFSIQKQTISLNYSYHFSER